MGNDGPSNGFAASPSTDFDNVAAVVAQWAIAL